jgi:hypothetical protein
MKKILFVQRAENRDFCGLLTAKIYNIKQALTVFAALCGGLFPAFAQSGDAGAGGASAFIRESSGTVEVKPEGASEWTAAAVGMSLARDTLISTGFKSSAVLALGNSTLTVRPLTRLTIEEIAGASGGETVSLYLRSGRVRAEVSPPPGGKVDFTVHSPKATASVRGTGFEFDTLRLDVYDGTVAFTGASGNVVYVRQGENSRIDSAGQSIPPYISVLDNLVPSPPVQSTAGRNGLVAQAFPETPMGGMGIGVGWYSPGDSGGGLGFGGGVGWYSPGGSSGGTAGIGIGW